MPIDSSIYGRLRNPDFIDQFNKGKELRQLADARQMEMDEAQRKLQKEKGINEAYSAGMVKNPDGTTGFDQNRTLEALAGVGGKEYLDAKSKFQEQDRAQQQLDAEKQQKKFDMIARLAGSAKDQQSYEQSLAIASQNGVDVSKLPRTYDAGLMRQYEQMALSAKDKLEQQWKQKEFGLKQQELGIRRAESANKLRSGEGLPLDAKKTVETLSSKNANKTAIANQIDAVMGGWDQLNDDQKLSMGRQLLKTLNSPEGADAIGVEEANRLGSKLEFALGNVTNSNPTQFGRDLPGFADQARNTSRFIKEAVQTNKDEIDRIMGRAPAPQQANQTPKVQPAQSHPQASQALEWAKQNQNDPRAQAILKRLGN